MPSISARSAAAAAQWCAAAAASRPDAAAAIAHFSQLFKLGPYIAGGVAAPRFHPDYVPPYFP
eukprot:3701999-Prymnesium_polylepis.1